MLRAHIECRTAAGRGLRAGDRECPARARASARSPSGRGGRRPRRCARLRRRAAGTGPACVACDERQLAGADRSASDAVDVLEMDVDRSARRASRTNSTGSTPPISRWPVSKHQGDVGVRERPLDVVRRLDERADVRVQHELEALGGDEVGELAQLRARRAASRRRRAARAPTTRGPATSAATKTSAPAAASCAAARRAGSRGRRARLVDDDAARTRRPAAGRSGRARRGRRRRRAAASPAARARWRSGPSSPSRRSTRSGGSCRPQPGTSQTPHEIGAAASRRRDRRSSACPLLAPSSSGASVGALQSPRDANGCRAPMQVFH